MEIHEIENTAYELILKNRKPIDIAKLKGQSVPTELEYAHTIYVGAISDFLLALQEIPLIEKPKLKRHRATNNCPIWEMSDFENYKKQRRYNPKTKTWKIKGDKIRRSLYLPFESLITMILDYKNEIPITETFEKIKSGAKTPQGLITYRNMYRAGAFNDSIYENALSYGYNPQDLISTEFKGEC